MRRPPVLHACALMFVAYAGYARIATLGEEVHEPQPHDSACDHPMALVIPPVLYVAVATVSIAAIGRDAMAGRIAQRAATLEVVVAGQFGHPAIRWIVAAGAVTAMLGVLLNLLLGLSRVLFAMGRGGDMPAATAALNQRQNHALCRRSGRRHRHRRAGRHWQRQDNVVLQRFFRSRFITPLRTWRRLLAQGGAASIRRGLPGSAGELACSLAFWVEWQIWAVGVGIIVAGLVWHAIAVALRQRE